MNITPITFTPALRNDIHVVPLQGNWAIKGENLNRYLGTFDTQYQAIAAGREMAIEEASSLVIHNRLGQFREVRSFS